MKTGCHVYHVENLGTLLPPSSNAAYSSQSYYTRHFFTSSYDGQVRIFDYSQNLIQSIAVHEAAATFLAILPGPSDAGTDTRLVATASHDLSARLTQVNLASGDSSVPARTLASLRLHTGPLTSISRNNQGTHLLTASHDGLVGLWDTTIPSTDEVLVEEQLGNDRKKRRKLADSESDRPTRKAPLLVLKSHVGRVSKALYVGEDGKQAVSAGFDSTVRSWDTETGLCTRTIVCVFNHYFMVFVLDNFVRSQPASSKPFLDIAVMSLGQSVLAASTDRTVTQYDLRSADSTSLTSTIATFAHPATPSCIAVSASQHQFVTGAYDGSVRLWDVRSVKVPVASFKVWDGQKKVLSVDWVGGLVGIGGEGGVEVWRMSEGDRIPS